VKNQLNAIVFTGAKNLVPSSVTTEVVTGMVGDGGNDCGALRTAHAGLALSEAEASMVRGSGCHNGR
jgi:P-type E1-E2 ATPase